MESMYKGSQAEEREGVEEKKELKTKHSEDPHLNDHRQPQTDSDVL